MKRRFTFLAFAGVLAAAGILYGTGKLEGLERYASKVLETKEAKPKTVSSEPPVPVVTVVAAMPQPLTEVVEATGSIVAREDILVAPEVSNQRVLDVLVEEGDWVDKGQVLARLVSVNLAAQIAQNKASTQRAIAAIAQAKSMIAQATATVEEATSSLRRARMLSKSGHLAQSVLDQRVAAARTAEAQLASARDGLRAAEAEKAQSVAQLVELKWRLENTEIRAPAAGVVSRRNARIGAIASGGSEPMFRVIKDGEVELKAEVTGRYLAKIATGQGATVTGAAAAEGRGKVRLISPEVDPKTRLGHVRISLPRNPAFRVGSYARARIAVARSDGLTVPMAAVMYDGDQAYVLVVGSDTARRRVITTGLSASGMVEVTSGLAAGEKIVAKAGTFLRDGDQVRPVASGASRLSKVN